MTALSEKRESKRHSETKSKARQLFASLIAFWL